VIFRMRIYHLATLLLSMPTPIQSIYTTLTALLEKYSYIVHKSSARINIGMFSLVIWQLRLVDKCCAYPYIWEHCLSIICIIWVHQRALENSPALKAC
jgi:hypothetical protein